MKHRASKDGSPLGGDVVPKDASPLEREPLPASANPDLARIKRKIIQRGESE